MSEPRDPQDVQLARRTKAPRPPGSDAAPDVLEAEVPQRAAPRLAVVSYGKLPGQALAWWTFLGFSGFALSRPWLADGLPPGHPLLSTTALFVALLVAVVFRTAVGRLLARAPRVELERLEQSWREIHGEDALPQARSLAAAAAGIVELLQKMQEHARLPEADQAHLAAIVQLRAVVQTRQGRPLLFAAVLAVVGALALSL